MVIPLVGILVSLAFLIFMAYRGNSVVIIAPIAALIAVVFSWDPLLANYTQIFMPAAGKFIITFFPLFLLGAIFGRLMSVSGYAEDLALWIQTTFGHKRAILATTIITALLAYGGVNAWVIAFTVVPIARPLFVRAGVSLNLLPAAIALGMFTFATAALPGTPQIHNAIPGPFFGTTTFSAPIAGLVGTVITFTLGLSWLRWREKNLRRTDAPALQAALAELEAEEANNATTPAPAQVDSVIQGAPEVYEATAASPSKPLSAEEQSSAGVQTATVAEAGSSTARGLRALLPILIMVAVNASVVYLIAPNMDFEYLAEEKFGATELKSVLGVWSVALALFFAILTIFLMNLRRLKEYIEALNEGARNAVLPVFTTASEVGYGAVITALAVFAVIRDSLETVSDNPLVMGTVATAVIAGITGSSSGGLTITLQAFGEQLAAMADAQGISLELMHRVIAMASVSFDSLPHNGAIVTLLLVCGMTHRQAYKDIAAVTVAVPVIGVIAVILWGTLFPSLI